MRRLRDVLVSLGVALSVVVGGGSAWADRADGNGVARTSHGISYSLQSFRAIALSDTSPVAFGNIRQGHTATLAGPDVLYGTTWTGDQIFATILPESLPGIDLLIEVLEVAPPDNDGCDTATGTEGTISAMPVVLTADPGVLITGITDCGVGSGARATDAYATTELTVDASAASVDRDYTVPVATTVTYTIDAGV